MGRISSTKITFFLGAIIVVVFVCLVAARNISFDPIVGSYSLFPHPTESAYKTSGFAAFLISPTPTTTQIQQTPKTPNTNTPPFLNPIENPVDVNLPQIPSSITTTLVVTQPMIDAFLKNIDPNELPFKNPSLTLSGDTAIVGFDMTSPIQGRLTATAKVSMTNSKVNVDIISGNYGGITLPDFLISPVETELNKFINENITQIPDTTIEDVYLQGNKIYVKATVKSSILTDFFDK